MVGFFAHDALSLSVRIFSVGSCFDLARLPSTRRQGLLAEDEIGGFLADHHGGSVGVSVRNLRKDRRIGNAQTFDADHATLRIDDCLLVAEASHATGAAGVIGAFCLLSAEGIERLVRLRLLSWSEFSSFEGFQRLLGYDLSSHVESLSHERKVFFVRHIIESDFGRLSWIRRDDFDRAARF